MSTWAQVSANGALHGMTIVLIEDYAIVRVALKHLLDGVPGFDDVHALSFEQLAAVKSDTDIHAELLLFGAGDADHATLQSFALATSLFSPDRAIMLYASPDPALLAACVRAEFRGFIPRSSTPEAILLAINLVMLEGECFPRPPAQTAADHDGRPVLALVNGSNPQGRRDGSRSMEMDGISSRALTPRQLAILKLLAQGNTMREIGVEMGISVATVKSHARTLYWKLNARNQAEATFIAIHQGLL